MRPGAEHRGMRIASVAKVVLASIALVACGNSVAGPATLSPSAATVLVGDRTTFALTPAQSATWSVNGMPGGNGTVGTISSIGVYTAPLVVPSPSTVSVGASVATNTALVSIVSRFVDDGPFAVESCLVPGACLGEVAAPDLDRDGLSDLIAAGTASGTLSVIMRANPSSFSPPVSYDVGERATSQPRSLVTGDWDGDGILDVAVADADPLKGQAVEVWLGGGDGHGTLQTEVRTPLLALSDPVSIASGHFDPTLNTTRNLDVVVARFGTVLVPSSLVVLLGGDAVEFLVAVKELLEDPPRMLLEV